ncbi:hypothetical protein [Klebsiella spallanzanii]|uniref:hypothetical protein n=1 Tax=Klebsiella spallanzanii TaxID=2587528 RepID=UPI00116D7039|nr:hypothetical protein SB6419_03255 [Klebsiella spallanzanii]
MAGFDPALGSTSPAVLLDNAKRLDELVNGSAADIPDRAGDPLYSWRQMMEKNEALTEEARQNLIPLSRQYMTLEAAQADIENIPEGSTTYVRSPDGGTLADEYINNGGTLEATGRRMPSQKSVDSVSSSVAALYLGPETLSSGARAAPDYTYVFPKAVDAELIPLIKLYVYAAGTVYIKVFDLVDGVFTQSAIYYYNFATAGEHEITNLNITRGQYIGFYAPAVLAVDTATPAGESSRYIGKPGLLTELQNTGIEQESTFQIQVFPVFTAALGELTEDAQQGLEGRLMLDGTAAGNPSPVAGSTTSTSRIFIYATPSYGLKTAKLTFWSNAASSGKPGEGAGMIKIYRMALVNGVFTQRGDPLEYICFPGRNVIDNIAVENGEYLAFTSDAGIHYTGSSSAVPDSQKFYVAVVGETLTAAVLKSDAVIQAYVEFTGITAALDSTPALVGTLAGFLAGKTFQSDSETSVSWGGTVTQDVSSHNVLNITLTDTVSSMAFTGLPAAGVMKDIALRITQSGGAGIIWPSSITWANTKSVVGNASAVWGHSPTPQISEIAGTQLLVRLYTFDGGASWLGFAVANNGMLPDLVAYDPFYMSTAVTLSGRKTPLGAFPWTTAAGATTGLTFNGDNLSNVKDSGTANQTAVIDIARTEYTLWTTMASASVGTSAKNAALVFRFQDANNFWYIEYSYRWKTLGVYVMVNGVVDAMNRVLYYLPSSATALASLRVDVHDAGFTVFLNGSEIMNVVDTTFSAATRVGIQHRVAGAGDGSPRWKYLAVTAFAGTKLAWPVTPVHSSSAPVVPLGASGTWDDTDVNNPNVIIDPVNGGFVMDYSGYHSDGSNGGQGTRVQHAGYARATSINGPWTKDAANPIMTATAAEGIYAFNGGLVYSETLGLFIRVYVSTGQGGGLVGATSPDGYTWTRLGVVVPPNIWATSLFDPFLRIKPDGSFECLYCGQASNLRAFGRAVSTDGVHWTDIDSGKPFYKPDYNVLAWAQIGEPTAIVPSAAVEGQQYLLTFDGVPKSISTVNRQLHQAITLDGGATWRVRYGFIRPSTDASSWMSVQAFDNFPYRDGNTLHWFHGGGDKSGASLNLNIQIGHATCEWAHDNLKL